MPENRFKKIFASRLILFLLLLAVAWSGIVLAKAFYKKNQLQSEIDNLKSEIEKTDKSNRELAEMINYFGSSGFLEKEAREKLNLKKEGETVIMVPEAAIGNISPAAANSQISIEQAGRAASAPENNFIKWWKYFFGR